MYLDIKLLVFEKKICHQARNISSPFFVSSWHLIRTNFFISAVFFKLCVSSFWRVNFCKLGQKSFFVQELKSAKSSNRMGQVKRRACIAHRRRDHSSMIQNRERHFKLKIYSSTVRASFFAAAPRTSLTGLQSTVTALPNANYRTEIHHSFLSTPPQTHW